MKVNIEIDCTPLEARQFFGLPDVAPMQTAVMDKLQQQMMSNIDKVSPESLIQSWFSFDPKIAERMQDMFVTMTGLGTLAQRQEEVMTAGRDEAQASPRLRPPGLGLLLAEARGIFEFNASLLLSPLLMRAPRGDGHPVLALPGFLASDLSMAPLRRYLAELGYDAHAWRMGRNIGGIAKMRAALLDRLARNPRAKPAARSRSSAGASAASMRATSRCRRPRWCAMSSRSAAPLPMTSGRPTRRGSTRRCPAKPSATIPNWSRRSPAICRCRRPRSIRGATAS